MARKRAIGNGMIHKLRKMMSNAQTIKPNIFHSSTLLNISFHSSGVKPVITTMAAEIARNIANIALLLLNLLIFRFLFVPLPPLSDPSGGTFIISVDARRPRWIAGCFVSPTRSLRFLLRNPAQHRATSYADKL